MIRIAVVDYGLGNVRSICNALEKVGVEAVVTRNAAELCAVDGVVLPGVGAFAHGMEKLVNLSLVDPIKELASNGMPMLGICLGMQMLFSSSTEFGSTKGLGIVPGEVTQLINRSGEKLPHINWAKLQSEKIDWEGTILDKVMAGEMYFVHSFVAEPGDVNHVLSRSLYGEHSFCSSVKSGNVFGCQFHPEKSGEMGLRIINNFKKICEGIKNV